MPLIAAAPYQIKLATDAVLKSKLTANVSSLITYAKHGAKSPVPKKNVPFSLILMAKDGNHKYAGVHDWDMCYSGSLPKVAVMYAAFEYRAAANRFLQANKITTSDDFLGDFSAAIRDALKKTPFAKYNDLPIAGAPDFDVIAKFVDVPPPFIDFQQAFSDTMDQMIVPSSDPAAAAIIDALGYNYINSALWAAGLSQLALGKRGDKGEPGSVIMITGDYSRKASHFVNSSETVNDGHGKVAMNTRGVAKLVALLLQDDMFDGGDPGVLRSGTDFTKPDRSRMQDLLQRASVPHPMTAFDEPFILRGTTFPPFSLEMNKLGQGPIGIDPSTIGGKDNPELDVSSEVSVLVWKGDPADSTDRDKQKALLDAKGLTGLIVVCWQNYRGFFAGGTSTQISQIVVKTMQQFLAA